MSGEDDHSEQEKVTKDAALWRYSRSIKILFALMALLMIFGPIRGMVKSYQRDQLPVLCAERVATVKVVSSKKYVTAYRSGFRHLVTFADLPEAKQLEFFDGYRAWPVAKPGDRVKMTICHREGDEFWRYTGLHTVERVP